MRLGDNEYEALLRICSLAIPATDDPHLKASLMSASRKLEVSRAAKRSITKTDRMKAAQRHSMVRSAERAA